MPRGMAGILQSFSSSQCGYISTSGGTLGLYLLIDFSIELGVEANIHSAVQNNAIKSRSTRKSHSVHFLPWVYPHLFRSPPDRVDPRSIRFAKTNVRSFAGKNLRSLATSVALHETAPLEFTVTLPHLGVLVRVVAPPTAHEVTTVRVRRRSVAQSPLRPHAAGFSVLFAIVRRSLDEDQVRF